MHAVMRLRRSSTFVGVASVSFRFAFCFASQFAFHFVSSTWLMVRARVRVMSGPGNVFSNVVDVIDFGSAVTSSECECFIRCHLSCKGTPTHVIKLSPF